MLRTIIVTGVCIAALMGAVKDGRVLHATGLTGGCTIAQHYTDGTALAACRSGKLEGRPSLAHDGCTAAGITGTYEYWRCPAGIATH